MRILLAEDNEDILRLFSHVLRVNGAALDTVSDGLEALNRGLNEAYDLILMDIQMPVMSGYEATEELRKNNYKAPIVALTARVMEEEREKAKKSGCNDCLGKPTDINQFLNYVKSYYQRRDIDDQIGRKNYQTSTYPSPIPPIL